MQRNIKLAKEILDIIISETNGGGGLYRDEIHAVFVERYPDYERGRDDHVEYHLHLLETGGFVKVTEDPEGDRDKDNFELTWAGHDYVEEKVHKSGFFS